MYHSVAYQSLFNRSLSSGIDTEIELRKNAMSFNRVSSWSVNAAPHGQSYLGYFTRIRGIYQFEALLYFALNLVYISYMVFLFTTISEAAPLIIEYREVMMAGGQLSDEKKQKLKDILEEAPTYWFQAIWVNMWTFFIPINIINKFMYAKL